MVSAQFRQAGLGRDYRAPPPAMRQGVFYGLVGALLFSNAVLVVVLFMSGDVARLMGQGEAEIVSYETRIADLRTEVDRLHSREYVREGDVNLQVHDLVQQQEDLAQQHQLLKSLTRTAQGLGLLAETAPSPMPALVRTSDSASLSLPAIRTSLDAMARDNMQAMSVLSSVARASSDKVLSALDSIGMTPPKAALQADGMGGPFEPARDSDASSSDSAALFDAANAVAADLHRFAKVRGLAKEAPIHEPLAGKLRITSLFGNRIDPFVGTSAFHPGLDLAALTGTPVRATGAGVVDFAGPRGGYGNMVEIDHGDGIVSRYGHLSSILVQKGDRLETGDILGRVGSTGRSTGPHLHFEIRRKDIAVNPQIFLTAGNALQAFL